MQLRTARLCLDCDEVHDAQQCPSCASETFAFITRWVPVPERQPKRSRSPEVASPETLDTYREMLGPDERRGGAWRTIRRGAVGLALFGLAGWVWRQNARPSADTASARDDSASSNRRP